MTPPLDSDEVYFSHACAESTIIVSQIKTILNYSFVVFHKEQKQHLTSSIFNSGEKGLLENEIVVK